MTTLRYRLLDVFAERLFGGNQLAVFTDGSSLSTAVMQSIARELNLSESVFVLPPEAEDADHKLRIFTPAVELPIAGHPTVGTAYALTEGDAGGEPRTLRLEEGVGVLSVEVRFADGAPDLILMDQPTPTFSDSPVSRERLAELLGLESNALDSRLPVEIGSAGVPFHLIPVRDAAALAAARVDLQLWDELLAGGEAPHLYVFRRGEAPGELYGRMFAPAMSIAEDPATGAAAGPMSAYAVRHGLASGDGTARLTIHQGVEMGRPSLIEGLVDHADGTIERVRIGGRCVPVGRGEIDLPPDLG